MQEWQAGIGSGAPHPSPTSLPSNRPSRYEIQEIALKTRCKASMSNCGSACRIRGSGPFPQNCRLSHSRTACAIPIPLLFSGSRNKALQRTTAAGCKRELAVLLSRSCKKAVGLPAASEPSQARSEPSRFDQVGKPVRRISSGNAPDPCWETSENNPPQDPGDNLSCASVARQTAGR